MSRLWIWQGVDSAGFLLCQLTSAGTTLPLRICLRVGQKRNVCKIWKVEEEEQPLLSAVHVRCSEGQMQMCWWPQRVFHGLCSASSSFPSLCPADNSNPKLSIYAEAMTFLACLHQLLTVVPFLQMDVPTSLYFPATSDFSLTSLRSFLGFSISSVRNWSFPHIV